MSRFNTVEDALAYAERMNIRIRVHYGNVGEGAGMEGVDWGDMYDVAGHIGRSMGPNRVRLLIHNARSLGGGALLEGCIVRVRYANRAQGGDLYRHPTYAPPAREDFSNAAEYDRHFA